MNSSTAEDYSPEFFSWYAYGELVVDKIVGVSRCEVASVACVSGAVPPPSLVRSMLQLPPHLGVEVTNVPHRRVSTLDDVIWLENGELHDLDSGNTYVAREPMLQLTKYDLAAEDIMRLHRLLIGYPEIDAPSTLADFLAAGVAHLSSLRSRFADLDALFERYATISRWRV